MEQVKNKKSKTQNFFLEDLFRKRVFWFSFVALGWFSAFFWLGGDAFFPLVLLSWLGGLHYLFRDVPLLKELTSFFSAFFAVPMEIFFVIFLFRVKQIPKKLLYWFAFFFIIIFILSLVGCSQMDYSALEHI